MIEEARHAPGPDPWWAETWCFEVVQPSIAALACLTVLPHQRQAWYWSVVLRPDEPVIHVADLAVRLAPRTLELRGNELWADHIVEEPGERWTIGNEANAIALDDPAEAFGPGYGTPTPLGIDAEWERSSSPHLGDDGYAVDAVVHGEVLIGSSRVELDGPGRWWHRWGPLRLVNAPRPSEPWAGVLLEPAGLLVEHTMAVDDGRWRHPEGSLSPP